MKVSGRRKRRRSNFVFCMPIQEADNAEEEDRTDQGEGAPAQE